MQAVSCRHATVRRFREGWIGRVHIGTTLTALTYELPPVLRGLRRDHPGIELLVTNMPTRDSVDGVLQNTIDLALVTLPVKAPRLRVTPLRPEMLVAILPAEMNHVPGMVTPHFAASQPLILEHARGAVHALVMQWLGGRLPLDVAPMVVGTIEAVKSLVGSGLGMSIVPELSVSEPGPEIVVRRLRPEVPCTLALIEQDRTVVDPAFHIVRQALLALRAPVEGRRG